MRSGAPLLAACIRGATWLEVLFEIFQHLCGTDFLCSHDGIINSPVLLVGISLVVRSRRRRHWCNPNTLGKTVFNNRLGTDRRQLPVFLDVFFAILRRMELPCRQQRSPSFVSPHANIGLHRSPSRCMSTSIMNPVMPAPASSNSSYQRITLFRAERWDGEDQHRCRNQRCIFPLQTRKLFFISGVAMETEYRAQTCG